MRRRYRLGRIAASLLGAVVLLVATAASAGADYETTPIYNYYQASVGGFLQCAQADSHLFAFPSAITSQSDSGAARDSGCGTPFTLPTAWICARPVLQWAQGGTWITVQDYGYLICNPSPNAFVTVTIANSYVANECWRTVGGHSVLLNGGWQQFLSVTPYGCT